MSEPSFPPPGNQAGYREAAAPAELEAPEPEDADSRRHVVGVRPDDPDEALRKAAIDDVLIGRQNARIAARLAAARRATAIMVALFALYIAAALLWDCFGHPRHRLF